VEFFNTAEEAERHGYRACKRCHPTEKLVQATFETQFGSMVAIASSDGIVLLEFCERKTLDKQLLRVKQHFSGVITNGRNVHLDQLKHELDLYMAGDLRRFTVPIVLKGTAMQEQVWMKLLEIPYGQTRSYTWLAGEVGKNLGQRAVAKANADNRLAILVPCHRVVALNGDLTGYAGGLWRKRKLLNLEAGERTLEV
jgi:AraC family transcriptional regulator of adaptative response/methylated-DNA-[protein]-cysteine methyltransferase